MDFLIQQQQQQGDPMHQMGGAGTIVSPSGSGGGMNGYDPVAQGDPVYDNLFQMAEQLAQGGGPGGGGGSYDVGNLSGDLATKRGVTLQEDALQSLLRLQRRRDLPVLQNITSGYRTREQQAALYAQKPDLAAPPGSSLHEEGLAIDVNSGWLAQHPVVRRWLTRHGWNQFDAQKEPWHFSYGQTG